MHIIIEGNPVDGFAFTGPFETAEDAVEYASNNIEPDWWTAQLHEPDEDYPIRYRPTEQLK